MIPPSSADLKDTLRAVLACNADAWIEALRVLPRRQAACIELIYYRDMTQEQAAEVADIGRAWLGEDAR